MNPLPLPLLLVLSLAVPRLASQGPGEVLAKFQLDGREAYVTRADVALEMAFHLRRRDEGRQAVEVLVDTELTRRAAKAKGVMPTQAEVRAFWNDLAEKFRAAGKRPEDFAAVRNSSEQELFADLAVQIAQERLVRDELRLGKDEHVGGDMLKLWLAEERRRTKIETDPDQLPVGTACRIDGQAIAQDQLGKLLLRTADDEQLQKFVQQVAFLQTVESMARAHGLQLTEADLDRAIHVRRTEAARDPRLSGLGYEQLLKSQGFTIASLRELRVFRAQVMLPLLADKLHPASELQAQLAGDRAGVLERVGPRRQVGMIFVRALETPNALVPNDFAGAMAKLRAARARLAKDPFDLVARIESDEPLSKQRGGDTGWHNRSDEDLPKIVLEAAFALGKGEVSEPLRGEDGCFLVKVLDVEPDLDDAALLARLRERAAADLKRQLVEGLKIESTQRPTSGR